jgi:hypothetical protein
LIIELKPDQLVIDLKAHGYWCQLPYPGHPKGCPNFGKKQGCPPKAMIFSQTYQPPYYLISETFDIESHINKMKQLHPQWTQRQCRNLLYWQKSVNKKLREKSKQYLASLNDEHLMLLEIPEATGINIFETCRNVGIALEKLPEHQVTKIMIIAKRK